MKARERKAGRNDTTGQPKPTPPASHDVDPHLAVGKQDEPLGRVDIAPAKPLWPSKK